jgi:hypothetical protein
VIAVTSSFACTICKGVVMGRTLTVVVLFGAVLCLEPTPRAVPAGAKKEAGERKSAKALARPFLYPKAKDLRWDQEGHGVYHVIFVTPDDLRKVAAWYQHKVVSGGGVVLGTNPLNGTAESALEDSTQPGKADLEPGEARPVGLHVYLKRNREFTVNAVVSRAKGEALTHVVLTLFTKDAGIR